MRDGQADYWDCETCDRRRQFEEVDPEGLDLLCQSCPAVTGEQIELTSYVAWLLKLESRCRRYQCGPSAMMGEDEVLMRDLDRVAVAESEHEKQKELERKARGGKR